MKTIIASLGVTVAMLAGTAYADTILAPLDRKVKLVDGVVQVVQNPKPDAVAVINLAANPPAITAVIENVPVSVVGPPSSAAITPDGEIALVTAAMKVDPADRAKQAADNRNEGSVSMFSISGKLVAPVGKLTIGPANSGPSGVIFTPDGKRALVSRDGDHKITLLNVDEANVTLANRDINAGLRPYGIDIAKDGKTAVVANIGIGTGDADTISVIDLSNGPPKVTDTLTVGQTPEGMALSPDGQYAAAVVMSGSNKPANSPFYAPRGRVVVFRIAGGKLTKVDEAAIGKWSQGAAFSLDSKTLIVGNMVEEEIQVLKFDGQKLSDEGVKLKVEGGPAAFGGRPHAR
jgi:DNA-binding beta-propeller fold protein YncE